jgi:heme O synthase-like polyprenyltransferase
MSSIWDVGCTWLPCMCGCAATIYTIFTIYTIYGAEWTELRTWLGIFAGLMRSHVGLRTLRDPGADAAHTLGAWALVRSPARDAPDGIFPSNF